MHPCFNTYLVVERAEPLVAHDSIVLALASGTVQAGSQATTTIVRNRIFKYD